MTSDLDPDFQFNPLSSYFDHSVIQSRRLAVLSNQPMVHLEYCLTCCKYHRHRQSTTLSIQCPDCYTNTDISLYPGLLGRDKYRQLSILYHLSQEVNMEAEYLATICYTLLDKYYQHKQRSFLL